eukprot:UN28134
MGLCKKICEHDCCIFKDYVEGGLLNTSPGSYAINVGFPIIFFAFYSLRMVFVEPLYTWLPYIPIISPIYGQGKHYKSSTEITFAILIHIIAGSLLFFCGLAQFDKKLRNKYPIFHRWIGRCYVTLGCIMVYALQILRPITGIGSGTTPSVLLQRFIDVCTILWLGTIIC